MHIDTDPTVTPEPEHTPLIVPSRYINYANGLSLYVYGHDGTTIVDILKFKRIGNRFVPDGWE